ncbi:ribosomal maturation YjgA family protein [Actinoplanes sp. NPDC004185]
MRGRLAALAAVVVIVGLAFGIRSVSDGGLEQWSGTALYASMIYAGVFLLWPAAPPVRAGILAVAFCWAVEFSQLTGVPAALSERSPAARLVLGASFDWVDVAWYPVGVVPFVVLHLLVSRRGAGSAATAGRGSRVGSRPG